MTQTPESAPVAVAEAAADWFMRIRDDEMSDADLLAWRRWLAADPANARAFDDIVAVWKAADRLDDLPWPGADELANDAYDGADAIPLPRRVGRRRALALAAALAAVLIIPLSLFASGALTPAPQAHVMSYRTGIGEHREILLADGSRIELGAGSTLDVAMEADARRIALARGEAFFHVAPDKARPFAVSAGGGEVIAVGTAFNVKVGAGTVTVSVMEGHVRVLGDLDADAGDGQADAVRDLFSGQDVRYDSDGRLTPVKSANVALATSWRHGRLSFVDAPLDVVIADVNRYSARPLVIGEAAAGALRFTGTVFPESLPDWLAGLERALPVRIVERDGETVVLAAPAAK